MEMKKLIYILPFIFLFACKTNRVQINSLIKPSQIKPCADNQLLCTVNGKWECVDKSAVESHSHTSSDGSILYVYNAASNEYDAVVQVDLFSPNVDTTGLCAFIKSKDTNTTKPIPSTPVDNGDGTFTTTYTYNVVDADGNVISTETFDVVDTDTQLTPAALNGIINQASLNCDTVMQCVYDNMGNIVDSLTIDLFASSSFLDSLNSNISCSALADCVNSSPFLDSLAVALNSSPLVDSLSSLISSNDDICNSQIACLSTAFDPSNQPNDFTDGLSDYLNSNIDCDTVMNCVYDNISSLSDSLASSIFDPSNQPNPFLDSLNNNLGGGGNYANDPTFCPEVAKCLTSSPALDSLAVAMTSSPVIDSIAAILSDPCSSPPKSYFHTIEVAAAGPLTTGQQDASILATTVNGGGSLTHGAYKIVSVTQNCEVGNATTQIYANGAAVTPTFQNGVTAMSHSGAGGENIFLRTVAAGGASHCWYSIGIITEISPCP